jgi:hypothetical protein
MHHGYAQAEGVANLDKVPETGALVIIGYPKFGGGLGGYARFIAVCAPDWSYGANHWPCGCAAAEIREAPALRCVGRHARAVRSGVVAAAPVKA